tara:strand:- start:70 stop:276 length:207 start_codon:yes stop_codon:yes gene_type:complete
MFRFFFEFFLDFSGVRLIQAGLFVGFLFFWPNISKNMTKYQNLFPSQISNNSPNFATKFQTATLGEIF